MKNNNKFFKALLSACAILSLITAGCVNAFALGAAPVTANEGNFSVWIFAAIIAMAAIGGIVYFIIQHKNKK
jgi:hypothetical protein